MPARHPIKRVPKNVIYMWTMTDSVFILNCNTHGYDWTKNPINLSYKMHLQGSLAYLDKRNCYGQVSKDSILGHEKMYLLTIKSNSRGADQDWRSFLFGCGVDCRNYLQPSPDVNTWYFFRHSYEQTKHDTRPNELTCGRFAIPWMLRPPCNS